MAGEPPDILVVGATSGLGRSLASKFAREGHRVVGTGRNVVEGNSNPVPGQTALYGLDVTDDSSVENFVRVLKRIDFAPDIAILSAGFGVGGPVETTGYDLALKQFQTNYFGVDRIVKALLPGMRSAKAGRIVIIGSIASRLPLAFQAHYTASKAAIAAYAYALAQEVMQFGVTVTVVEPGDHNTSFTRAREFSDAVDAGYEPNLTMAMNTMEKNEAEGSSPELFAERTYSMLMANSSKIEFRVTKKQESFVIFLDRFLKKDRIIRILMRYFGIKN